MKQLGKVPQRNCSHCFPLIGAGEQLNEMNPEVMEEEEELAFRLRLLHLVELTQKDDVDEMLRFAHEELAFRVQDKVGQ